jgi:uncharacterized iron-regulated membrane protein
MSSFVSIVASNRDTGPDASLGVSGPDFTRLAGLAGLRKLSRKLHQFLAWVVIAPSILIFSTGVLLLLRQNVAWIQPPAMMGTQAGLPVVGIERAFEVARSVPEAGISSWQDLSSIDIRPAKGTLAFRAKNGYEVQIDGLSGAVVSAAPRRTSFLIELHQGTYFHPKAMTWWTLPVGLGLLSLSVSGLFLLRRKRAG